MKITFKNFKTQFGLLVNEYRRILSDDYKDHVLHLTNQLDFSIISKNVSEKKVWTICKGSNESLHAIPGKHTHLNPVGFFVTEKPYSTHQYETLKIIINPGYEDIKATDVSYLKLIKEQLEKKEIPFLNTESFDRLIFNLSKKF